MRLTLTASVVLTAGILAAPVSAQPLEAPRFEIGGQVSALAPVVPLPAPIVLFGAGLGATLRVARRLAFELQTDIVGSLEGQQTSGVYIGQVKVAIRDGAGHSLFVTGGVAGPFVRSTYQERRLARPDGSIVVHPGSRSFRIFAPSLATLGIARQQHFARCCSHTVAAQAYIGHGGGIGVRATFGIAFGLGGAR